MNYFILKSDKYYQENFFTFNPQYAHIHYFIWQLTEKVDISNSK